MMKIVIYIDNLYDRTETTIFNAMTAHFREQERKVACELELQLDADLGIWTKGSRFPRSAVMPGNAFWKPTSRSKNTC